MRNGGYKGIIDPTSVADTRGIHNTRDAFELGKKFNGAWYSDARDPILADATYTTTNGGGSYFSTFSADGSYDWFGNSGDRGYSSILASGRFYFESYHNSGNLAMLGILHESFQGNFNTAGANMHYMSNGNLYPGNLSTGLSSITGYPELLRWCYDTTIGKFWFGANGGWSSRTGDPEYGGAGLDIWGWSTFGAEGNYRLLINSGTGGNGSFTGRYLMGADITLGTPAGFTKY